MKLAQINFGALENKATPNLGGTTFGSIITTLLTYILPLAGMVLLLYLLFAGFQYLTSAGDPKKVEQAKERLTSALVGFVIVFAAYWIVQIVGTVLGLGSTGFGDIFNLP